MTTHTLSDAQKTAEIRKVIVAAGDRFKQKYPFLRHQNAIGVSIMVLSLAGMIGSGFAYYYGLIAWWLCIPLVAIFASFIHELEHDLIHLMYFRKKPWANKLMLLIGWIARPSTVSPFVRRRLHLHHHKHSGTESDLEERGITNGERWGLRRLLMTGDNMLAVYLRPVKTRKMVRAYIKAQKPQSKAEVQALIKEQLRAYFPLGNLHYLAWHGFVVFHAIDLIASATGHAIVWPVMVSSVMSVIDFLAVVWLAPSALRTFCLHFISSNMHYYGDIEDENIMQQCQVLNSPWMLPFQLFCFNFGSTHAIHHFVVAQPFYIRQMVAKDAHQVMRKMGVRFNDFRSIARANRYQPESVSGTVASPVTAAA